MVPRRIEVENRPVSAVNDSSDRARISTVLRLRLSAANPVLPSLIIPMAPCVGDTVVNVPANPWVRFVALRRARRHRTGRRRSVEITHDSAQENDALIVVEGAGITDLQGRGGDSPQRPVQADSIQFGGPPVRSSLPNGRGGLQGRFHHAAIEFLNKPLRRRDQLRAATLCSRREVL